MIHLKLVISTALMAAARKVIVFDFKEHDYTVGLALGVLIIALGCCYWLICKTESKPEEVDLRRSDKETECSRS
jgi:uncharacterized membrane protein (DUF373 family)